MKKFNSDKIDGKSETQKSSFISNLTPSNNDHSNNQLQNNYQGKILYFNKKPKQGEYPSSASTTEENTPVK